MTGHESYQSLGGDSITTMQIVSKAREWGLIIDPIRLFESDSLNQVLAKSMSPTAHQLKTHMTSIHRLGPIQYWFFNKKSVQPNQFNQVVQLKLRQHFSVTLLETFLNKLTEAHPILCTRFENQAMTLVKHIGIHIHTIRANENISPPSLASLLHKLESQMDIRQGKLFQAGIRHTKPQPTLVLMVHHLVMDGVSWRILLNDLARLMQQHINGETLTLLPEQISFLAWADHLQKQAKRFYTTREINYWINQCRSIKQQSPTVEHVQKNSRTITQVFSAKEHWYRNGVSMAEKYFSPFIVLLTQTLRALALWQKQSDVFIMLESHGRYPLKKGIDVSRTVGWFTSLYPFYINIKKNITNIVLLDRIKSRLSAIPQHGTGYSMLKELHACESIKQLPTPEISFNYFGNFDHSITPAMRQFFVFSDEGIQLYNGPLNTRQHQIDITCYVYQEKIYFHIEYNHLLFSRTKMDKFFKFLNDTFKKFNQFSIGHQSYLPLSAMQQGLLFHSVEHPRSPVYWVRVRWEIREELNVDCYKQAWEMLLFQYPQLNVSIQWDKKGNMKQRLSQKTTLPFRYIDKTVHQPTKNKATWERETPIIRSLNKAPLFTITVLKLGTDHYITLFDHHHALLDGWSVGLLLNTLVKNYRNIMVNNQQTMITFQNPRAYVEHLLTVNKKSAKAFWQVYLKGVDPLLSLGVEKQSSKNSRKINMRRQTYSLSHQAVKKIDQIAKKFGITQNIIFQTAWAIVLSTYTHQSDIIFGMTFSVRNLEKMDILDQVGLYINTLPFRMTLNANDRIIDAWTSTKKNLNDVLRFGYVSLIDLKRWFDSSIPTDGFFKYLYVLENFPFKLDNFFKELSIYDPTHYPLTLSIEARNQYKIILSYDANDYTKNTVLNILKYYLHLLSITLNNHDHSFAQINLITEIQKKALLSNIQRPRVIFSNLTVYGLFERQVARTPNKIAIKYKNNCLSYKQLYDYSVKASAYFIKHNLKRGDYIGIYFKGVDLAIVAILGLLRLGAAYVPIDITYPPKRIKYILTTARLKNILTDFPVKESLKTELNGLQKFLSFDQRYFQENPLENLKYNCSSDNLMYIMFTSGSTGIPKGVKITHANVVNILSYFCNKLPISKEDVVLNNTILSFDISVLEIFGALTTGATLLLVNPTILNNPDLYKQFLEKEVPTVLQMTPSGWRRMIQTGWVPLPTMTLLSGGEALSKDIASILLKHVPYFWNVYGPTETTIWSTVKKIKNPRKITVGKAIANTNLFVVSHWDTLLPSGIPGELCIGGDGVAPEYINNIEETNRRFINIKIDSTCMRVYKTGDKVIAGNKDELTFLGRFDEQIKQYGYRIELGEIEAQLLKHDNIKNAAVFFGLENETPIIKAFVELKKTDRFFINSLKNYLYQFLPHYMMPGQYVVVEHIPTLANGKIDRRSLNNLKTICKRRSQKITTADYSLMLYLWTKVLKKNDIMLDDNFFQVGGNSLLALRLLINLEKSFNRKITFTMLLQCPTPRELMNQLYHWKKSKKPIQRTAVPNPIVRLNQTKSNKNLFLIHPIGGHIFWFASLSQHMKQDWNIYAIQDPGVITGNVYFLNLEEMCQFYQNAIRKIQPKGPYYLGGASFGATAAFEIAKQLLQANEKINFVGLFDGWANYPKAINTKKFMQNNMWRQYHEMETKTLGAQSFLMKPIIDIHWQRSNMLSKYKLECIPVTLTLFKSLETMLVFKSIDCDDNGWQPYTNKLNIIRVPGTHESMFYGDNVSTLGKKILEYLQKTNYSDMLKT